MFPRYLFVQSKARDLRRNIKNPPVPVYNIARKLSRVVMVNDPIIQDAACFYRYDKQEPRIFINTKVSSKGRLRYSIAHEIAHIVLGHFDILMYYAKTHNLKLEKLFFWSSIPELAPISRAFEREANIFAAEMLMPIEWLNTPKTENDFINLQNCLGVSRQALIYRLDETGIVAHNILEGILKNQKCVGIRTSIW